MQFTKYDFYRWKEENTTAGDLSERQHLSVKSHRIFQYMKQCQAKATSCSLHCCVQKEELLPQPHK